MPPIRNPFSRDEHPDLTAAILGVVNETHSRKTLEGLSTTALRKLRKEYQAGVAKGHKDAARELADIHGILRSRGAGAALDEAKSNPKPIAAVLKAAKRSVLADRGGLNTPKARAAKDKYKAAVKAAQAVDEAVTPAQQKVFARERERMLSALNNPKQKLSPTEREAVLARGARNAAAETRKGAVSPTGVKSPIHAAAKAHHEYARRESKKLDAIAKRKVQEAAQLDERIIDEVDFFQASKNWITGKGFKTNREVVYDRVNKNYAAMKKREAAAAKAKKTK
jgi:hypothetical protein